MTPVDMLVTHDPSKNVWGDCTRACVASIFDLPAEEVPHFAEDGLAAPRTDGCLPWVHRMREWLNVRGFDMVFVDVKEPAHHWPNDCLQFHYIVGGKTIRGTDHDTVWYQGKMVHDPHPERRGILLNEYPMLYTLIVKK